MSVLFATVRVWPVEKALGPMALVPLVAALTGALPAYGQGTSGGSPVYRCPGPPVLYTDAITPTEARDRGCRTIEGAPITIVQGRRPAASGAAAGSQPQGGAAARGGDTRVEPNAQRQRDTEARRILQEELKREEERLAVLSKEYNNGEPERRGDERNYQRYIDRVAEMKAALARKEADIAALRREIAKLPAP